MHAQIYLHTDSDLFCDRNATKYKTNDKKNKKRSPYQGDAVIKRASQHAPVLHLCTSRQKMSKQINLSFFTTKARSCEGFWYWKSCRQWKASDQMDHNVKIFFSVKWVRGLVKVDIWSFKLPGKNVPVCLWDFGWKIWKITNALCRQLS